MTTWGSPGHLEAIAARRDAEDERFREGQREWLESTATCEHPAIRVFFVGETPAVWACGDCRLRFYPACRTCVDVGHRNGEHPA